MRDTIEASDNVRVARSTYEWAKTVKRGSPYALKFSSYGTHSLGPYSLDCEFHATPGPDGYYPPNVVIQFLRHVAGVSSGKWDWWVLYTDSRVAEVINEELGTRRVSFQWEHGPKHYKLHLHFDVHPLGSVVPQPYEPLEPQQSLPDETESRVPYGFKHPRVRKKPPRPRTPQP